MLLISVLHIPFLLERNLTKSRMYNRGLGQVSYNFLLDDLPTFYYWELPTERSAYLICQSTKPPCRWYANILQLKTYYRMIWPPPAIENFLLDVFLLFTTKLLSKWSVHLFYYWRFNWMICLPLYVENLQPKYLATFCCGNFLHRKKRFTSFPSPAGMSLTKLPLGSNNSVMT